MRELTIPYAPRRQFKAFHNRTQRWACMAVHRRGGKTVSGINDLVKRAIEIRIPHGRFAYVAPFLSQAKEVAWEYLKRYAQPVTRKVNESELWVELLNGSRVRIHGADNPDRLRGGYLDGVILDEYADMRTTVWGEVIRPMLADRMGWALFIGTPKGKNEFYQMLKLAEANPAEWYSLTLPASESGILAQVELDDAARSMTPEQYAQEFECSFEAAITGAYYGRELAAASAEGRVSGVPYEPDLPVHTAWDLGVGDATAIWFFQVHGREIRVIDYYESHGVGLDHYAGVLRERGYRYGDDWVPHDARVRELSTGRTRLETFVSLGRKPKLVKEHKLFDGINATRLTLPNVWFDEAKTFQGLEALRQYRPDWDDRLKTFRDQPRHDWTSHAADAFRYLAMAWREIVPEPVVQPKPMMLQHTTFSDFLSQTPAKPRERV